CWVRPRGCRGAGPGAKVWCPVPAASQGRTKDGVECVLVALPVARVEVNGCGRPLGNFHAVFADLCPSAVLPALDMPSGFIATTEVRVRVLTSTAAVSW